MCFTDRDILNDVFVGDLSLRTSTPESPYSYRHMAYTPLSPDDDDGE